MENIDFPSLQQKTYNGEFVHLIIDELEKEIDSETAIAIKSFFYSLHISLDNFLDNVLYYADAYCSEGKDDYAIDYINQKIQTISTRKYFIYNLDDFSPIEMMYFRILQYKHIGQVKDIIFVNNIKFDINCNISPSMIEEMKELAKCKIQIDEIELFINDAPHIARYVYLREDISENDIKKIRRKKDKAKQMINFLYRATPLKKVNFLLNKLHIISFLQAIILDEKNEIFDYTFYGYQKSMKHKQHVQIAINQDKRPVDALKVYWSRKINDHWYANIGRYEMRCKMRELENICDTALLSFLNDI